MKSAQAARHRRLRSQWLSHPPSVVGANICDHDLGPGHCCAGGIGDGAADGTKVRLGEERFIE